MNQGNALWDGFRSLLIAGGTLSAAYFGFSPEIVEPFVDNVLTVASASVAAGSFIWMMWVKFRTVSVPVEEAIQAQVLTVSPVTGAIQPPPVA
jgi:hypothetical protein